MSDLTHDFEIPMIVLPNGGTAGTIDGAAFIDMRSSPRDWEVVEIKLNTWIRGARKSHYVTLRPDDRWFEEIANAIVIDLALSESIEKKLAELYGRPAAYDRGRQIVEAA